jgi:hypothetical protein
MNELCNMWICVGHTVESSNCAIGDYPKGFGCPMKALTNHAWCKQSACQWARDQQMHWYLWFGRPHVLSFVLPSFLLVSSTPPLSPLSVA